MFLEGKEVPEGLLRGACRRWVVWEVLAVCRQWVALEVLEECRLWAVWAVPVVLVGAVDCHQVCHQAESHPTFSK